MPDFVDTLIASTVAEVAPPPLDQPGDDFLGSLVQSGVSLGLEVFEAQGGPRQKEIEHQFREYKRTGGVLGASTGVAPESWGTARQTAGAVLGAAPQIGGDVLGLGLRAGELAGVMPAGSADVMNRESGFLAQDLEKAYPKAWGGSKQLRGAVRSVIPTIIAAQLGGTPAAIGYAAATEANQAYTDALDAGLDETAAKKYTLRAAAIEGGVAGIFQKLGLGGLESRAAAREFTKLGMRQSLKALGKDVMQEVPEELITEGLHAANESLSDVRPESLTKEALLERAGDTIMQTVFGVGMVHGTQQIAARIGEQPGGVDRVQAALTQIAGQDGAAADIVQTGRTSRKPFEKWGVTGLSGPERSQIMDELVRQAATPVQESRGPEVAGELQRLPEVPPPDVERPLQALTAQALPVTNQEEQTEKWTTELAAQTPETAPPPVPLTNRSPAAVAEAIEIIRTADPLPGIRAMAAELGRRPTRAEIRSLVPGASKAATSVLLDMVEPPAQISTPPAETVTEPPGPMQTGRPQEVEQPTPAQPTPTEPVAGAINRVISEPAQAEPLPPVKRRFGAKIAPQAAKPQDIGVPSKAATEALAEAGRQPEEESMGSLAGNLLTSWTPQNLVDKTPTVPVALPPNLAFPDKQSEVRWWGAHGIKAKTLAQRWASTKEKTFRLFRKVPALPENIHDYAPARDLQRLHKETDDNAKEGAALRVIADTIGLVTDPNLPAKEGEKRAAIERTLYDLTIGLRDKVQSIKDGAYRPMHGDPSPEAVEDHLRRVEADLPNHPKVQKALATRKANMTELMDQQIAVGNLDESWRGREENYRHLWVMKYTAEDQASSSKGFPSRKPFYLKERMKPEMGKPADWGAEYDANTLAIEFDARYYEEAERQIRTRKFFNKTMELYDLKQNAKVIKGEEYAEWTPPAGFTFTHVGSEADAALAAEIERTINANLPPELKPYIKWTLARKSYMIPKRLAQALNEMGTPRWAMPKWWQTGTRYMQGLLTSHGPGAPIYHGRNEFGDLGNYTRGVTAVEGARYTLAAKTEAWDYYIRKKPVRSERLALAMDLGVIGASFEVAELQDLKTMPLLERFAPGMEKNVAGKAWNATKRGFTAFAKFRESVLRLAAFNYALDTLNRTGTLPHYGRSNEAEFQAVRKALGNAHAAAKWSREALGDYRNLNVLNQYLRQIMPFWAFQAISMGEPRAIANSGIAAGRALKKGDVLPAAGIAARTFWMYAVLQAANKWLWPDKEKDLSRDDRASLHVPLWRWTDGSVAVIRNIGTMGEFFEWFGINSIISDWDRYKRGEKGWKDALLQAPEDTLNKLFGQLHFAKAGFEILSEKRYFPSVLRPRYQARDEALFSAIKGQDIWRWTKGKVGGGGERDRPHSWERFFGVGVSDPRQNAMSEVYAARDAFLSKHGLPIPEPPEKESSIRTMKEAAILNDKTAFEQAKTAYLKQPGKTRKKFVEAVQRMDPLHGLSMNKDLRQQFLREISPEDREYLTLATDATNRITERMIGWWPGGTY